MLLQLSNRRALLLGTVVVVAYSAIFIAANAMEINKRVKRSFLPFTMGHMTLRIKCADTTRDTVCAPGGPRDCPRIYRAEENRGACGFATISHFVSTGNIAGTCCIYDPTIGITTTTKSPTASSTPGSSTPKPSSTQGPRVVVYGVPVWGGYPNIPSYGDQSSPYAGGSHGSPIYAIEAVNGQIATVSNNPGAYVGSRSFPDFKITEVRPQTSEAAPNVRLDLPQQQQVQQHVTSVTVDHPIDAVTTVKVESEPVLEKRQLYPPASAAGGDGAASSPAEKGPLFYPYPALPQPKFAQNAAAAGGSNYPTAKIKRITVTQSGAAAPVRTVEDGDVKQIKSIDDMETF